MKKYDGEGVHQVLLSVLFKNEIKLCTDSKVTRKLYSKQCKKYTIKSLRVTTQGPRCCLRLSFYWYLSLTAILYTIGSFLIWSASLDYVIVCPLHIPFPIMHLNLHASPSMYIHKMYVT